MAQLIEFGGTSGVSVLDLGLPGGSIAGAGNGRSTMLLEVGGRQQATQERAMPETDVVLAHRLGVKGRTIIGRGQLVLASDALMNTVLAAIDAHLEDPEQFVPTQLVDNVTGQTWTKVYMNPHRVFGARVPEGTGTFVLLAFEIEFRSLED